VPGQRLMERLALAARRPRCADSSPEVLKVYVRVMPWRPVRRPSKLPARPRTPSMARRQAVIPAARSPNRTIGRECVRRRPIRLWQNVPAFLAERRTERLRAIGVPTVVRLCGGRNIRLCEGPAVSRRTPASRVLWCRGPGRAEQRSFCPTMWSGQLASSAGVLRSRQRCLTNSSARSGGGFGPSGPVGDGARANCMIAHGAGRNRLGSERPPGLRSEACRAMSQ
jgi:hypothetical protein